MAGRFEGPVGPREPHPDEHIVVYHSTTAEAAAHLKKYGTTQPKPVGRTSVIGNAGLAKSLGKNVGDSYDFEPGRGQGSGLYVTRHPGQGFLYGTHSLPVRIRAGDLAVPPEREHRMAPRGQMTPWRSLNVEDGYIHHALQPHQFGDIYTAADHREWTNHHG